MALAAPLCQTVKKNRLLVREPISDRARESVWSSGVVQARGPPGRPSVARGTTAPTTFKPTQTPPGRTNHSPRAPHSPLPLPASAARTAPVPCPSPTQHEEQPTPPRAVALPHRHRGPARGGPTCHRLLLLPHRAGGLGFSLSCDRCL